MWGVKGGVRWWGVVAVVSEWRVRVWKGTILVRAIQPDNGCEGRL